MRLKLGAARPTNSVTKFLKNVGMSTATLKRAQL